MPPTTIINKIIDIQFIYYVPPFHFCRLDIIKMDSRNNDSDLYVNNEFIYINLTTYYCKVINISYVNCVCHFVQQYIDRNINFKTSFCFKMNCAL